MMPLFAPPQINTTNRSTRAYVAGFWPNPGTLPGQLRNMYDRLAVEAVEKAKGPVESTEGTGSPVAVVKTNGTTNVLVSIKKE